MSGGSTAKEDLRINFYEDMQHFKRLTNGFCCLLVHHSEVLIDDWDELVEVLLVREVASADTLLVVINSTWRDSLSLGSLFPCTD